MQGRKFCSRNKGKYAIIGLQFENVPCFYQAQPQMKYRDRLWKKKTAKYKVL